MLKRTLNLGVANELPAAKDRRVVTEVDASKPFAWLESGKLGFYNRLIVGELLAKRCTGAGAAGKAKEQEQRCDNLCHGSNT